MVRRVREEIKYGVDVIKFCASGGVFSKGDNPLLEQVQPGGDGGAHYRVASPGEEGRYSRPLRSVDQGTR